jgi:beta-phosphoglucomutase-like phosphatase (HAD superfamily)
VGLFGALISAENVEKRKPDPEPIVRGLELIAVAAAKAAPFRYCLLLCVTLRPLP